MPERLKIYDILIPGAKLNVKKIDFNSPEIKATIERTITAQRKCLELKKIDLESLRRYINI